MLKYIEHELNKERVINEDEKILKVFKELFFDDSIEDFYFLLDLDFKSNDKIMKVYSKEFYNVVKEFTKKYEVMVETKYKIVIEKIK